MPIALEETCTCPHCNETFPLAQALAQEAIERLQANFTAEGNETIQAQLEAAKAEGAEQAKEEARRAANDAVQENVVNQEEKIAGLEATVLQMQTAAAAAQATQEQQTQNAITQAQQRWQETTTTQLQERDNQIRQLTANLANLNAQAQQGHAQAAGEVGEVAVENILRQTFPQDDVQTVLAGHHGADLILCVHERGVEVGKIIIEVKNTQNWSNQWLGTLKQNQANSNADLAVLVTNKFPAGMTEGGLRENVWVCRIAEFRYLIQALRQSVAAVAQANARLATRDTDAHHLYDFVQSTQFQHAMNSLVTPVLQMRENHESEKRALQRVWKKREKTIEAALSNATSILGSLAANMPQGQLPVIDGLPELEDLADDVDEEDNGED